MPPKDAVYVRSFMGYLYRASNENKSYSTTRTVTKEQWEKGCLPRIVLPKQWKHWCKDSGLFMSEPNKREYGGSSNRHNWMYLMGHGYMWRINADGMLEMGDTYEDFDRWALCTINQAPLPKTREEFRTAVKTMIAQREADNESEE